MHLLLYAVYKPASFDVISRVLRKLPCNWRKIVSSGISFSWFFLNCQIYKWKWGEGGTLRKISLYHENRCKWKRFCISFQNLLPPPSLIMFMTSSRVERLALVWLLVQFGNLKWLIIALDDENDGVKKMKNYRVETYVFISSKITK